MSTDAINTEIAATLPVLPEIRRDATVMELAQVIADSRAFPDCRSPAAAAVRILAGKEMGVGPIASVIGIRVNAGRVSMDATLMAGCIKRSERYDYKILAHDNEACQITFYENNEAAGLSVFTSTDAKTAGLLGKDTWRQYPRNMLFARALSNGARWYCPGIFGGSIYTHEELGYAIDEEGRATDPISEGSAANDLCTREQRQRMMLLAVEAGMSVPQLLADLGVRLLDELSGYEADKTIRKLEKKAAKKAASSPASETKPLPEDRPLTESQSTVSEAFDESRKPSTPEQRERILTAADKLGMDQHDLKVVLGKRNAQCIADLNHLQAEALIEAMEAKLQEPPFDPTPAAGSRPAGRKD